MNRTREIVKSVCIAICLILIIFQVCYIVKLSDYRHILLAENETASEQTVPDAQTADEPEQGDTENQAPAAEPTELVKEKIIVLDPGHGKSSSLMSEEERGLSGWAQNDDGDWGEWRHWKSGEMWIDCCGSGCNGLAPENGSCWYPIENGDRDGEGEINLRNAQAARNYLQEMGYTVRMTRETNDENPSITERIRSCYPQKDVTAAPDALVFVCVHSNAGGGSGSAYLSLGSGYDQGGISPTYVEDGNSLGAYINNRIVTETSLSAYSDGCYPGQPYLILFHKSPIPVGYMEIGFFDNSSDLAILESESDAIGRAIAEGIDEYVTANGL